MTLEQVANRLVALCREQKFLVAVDELYADDIISTELMSMPDVPAEQRGKQAVRAKSEWWLANHTVNSMSASDPLIADEYFAVMFAMDVTMKSNNQRMQMKEIALYQVKDGEIVSERFFYPLD